MAAAEVARPHLFAAQEYRGLLRKRDAWSTRLLEVDYVFPGVCMGNDFGGWQKFSVAPGVIAVVVCVDQVLDGLVSDAFDLVDDVIEIVFELIVDQNHTLVCNV